MSERWETVPVSREVRKVLWKWADDEAVFGELDNVDLYAAARQFREDVLAEPESRTRSPGTS